MVLKRDHTWVDPRASHGHFGTRDDNLRCYDVFAATDEDLPIVGRLCYLSFITGGNQKIRLKRGWNTRG